MALVGNGIDMVQGIELPAGIRADGNSFTAPRTALVRWRSSWNDKLHQVYVNGRYAGATIDFEQRELIVHLPNSFNAAVRIEISAVEPKDANTDFSSELGSAPVHNGRVKIKLLRSQNLPINSQAMIYSDSGTGIIDYVNPINRFPIRIWPCWQDKAGFGMSKFGVSDFGYDYAATLGFGRGLFGQIEFGADGDTIKWTSYLLPTGVYKFAVKIFDENGRESAASETSEVTVTSSAKPAESLTVTAFNKQTNQLVLCII
jgi:hypothetical protein